MIVCYMFNCPGQILHFYKKLSGNRNASSFVTTEGQHYTFMHNSRSKFMQRSPICIMHIFYTSIKLVCFWTTSCQQWQVWDGQIITLKHLLINLLFLLMEGSSILIREWIRTELSLCTSTVQIEHLLVANPVPVQCGSIVCKVFFVLGI